MKYSLRRDPWWNAGRRARLCGFCVRRLRTLVRGGREPHRKVRRIRISVLRRSAFLYLPEASLKEEFAVPDEIKESTAEDLPRRRARDHCRVGSANSGAKPRSGNDPTHPPPRGAPRDASVAGTPLRGRGTTRRVVEGAFDSSLLFRGKRFVACDAPSTIPLRRMVPLPRFRGAGGRARCHPWRPPPSRGR